MISFKFDYFCTSIPFLPDFGVQCLSQLFMLIFVIGFIFIVLESKKYSYMMEWIIKKLDGWF